MVYELEGYHKRVRRRRRRSKSKKKKKKNIRNHHCQIIVEANDLVQRGTIMYPIYPEHEQYHHGRGGHPISRTYDIFAASQFTSFKIPITTLAESTFGLPVFTLLLPLLFVRNKIHKIGEIPKLGTETIY